MRFEREGGGTVGERRWGVCGGPGLRLLSRRDRCDAERTLCGRWPCSRSDRSGMEGFGVLQKDEVARCRTN